jgi:hypothetical protein
MGDAIEKNRREWVTAKLILGEQYLKIPKESGGREL